MPPIRAERQRFGPAHGGERQLAVEGRKQGAAAGWFPFEGGTEGVGVDRKEHEVALAGKMFRGGLRDLIGGGKMDVAVGVVDRRAGKFARVFGRLPCSGA